MKIFTCCGILSAIVRRVFDENEFPFLQLLRLPPETFDRGVAAASRPADPVAQRVVGPVKKSVVEIDPKIK